MFPPPSLLSENVYYTCNLQPSLTWTTSSLYFIRAPQVGTSTVLKQKFMTIFPFHFTPLWVTDAIKYMHRSTNLSTEMALLLLTLLPCLMEKRGNAQ